jgi:hypothetical protein
VAELRLAGEGEQGTPLMVLAYANTKSFRRAGRAMTVLIAWAIAEQRLGRALGDGEGLTAAVREYTAWWKQSERTTWRDLQAFRAAFPTESSPAQLAAQLVARSEAKLAQRDAAAVGALLVAG